MPREKCQPLFYLLIKVLPDSNNGLYYAFQVSWKNLIILGSVKPEHRILSEVTTK